MPYQSKLPPWKHQAKALSLLRGKKAFALLMAMRTGKTKVLLDDFGRLESDREVNDLLVIAPAGVYHTWADAIKEHLGDPVSKRLLVHTWAASDKGKMDKLSLDDFMQPDPRKARILMVNVEALSNVERAQKLVLEFAGRRRSMIAVDESTTIKNFDALRTEFIVQELAPLSQYRRILSGLPTPKSPLDLYSQFEFLDQKILGFKSFYGFRARYAIMQKAPFGPKGRSIPIVVGYRDVEELADKIRPHSYRVRLEDCYDLPEKMYSIREVALTKEQEKHYREMKLFCTTQLNSVDHATSKQVIDQILRLHQILCGHVGTEEKGKFVEIPENRTKALIELLEEYDGKAVVWCSYDLNIRKVSAALEKHFSCKVAKFWGGNKSTREDEEKKFKTDPKCRFIVATAAAGGRGREWSVANLVVYYSNSADLEHRSQSEERAQLNYKNDRVAYVDLMVPGTVDERMIKTLRAKIDMSTVINGDNYREWLI